MNNISKENILRLFPEILQKSEKISALGEVLASYLVINANQTELCTLYANIDTLPELVLDILAYDFKIDWWDSELSIAQKRRTFRQSFYVHKHLGTLASVKDAIAAIYPDSEVLEWFDYEGKAYHFRLLLNVGDSERAISPELHQRVLENVLFYKSSRSVMESIEYFIHQDDVADLQLRTGAAFQLLTSVVFECAAPELPDVDFLVDDNGLFITDENGNMLI